VGPSVADTASPAIVSIETVRHPEHPNVLHVRLEAEDGVTGLGETFGPARSIEAYLHDVAAPRVLALADGSPAALREACSLGLYGAPRPAGAASVESSAASALDIAAWDAAARRRGVPLHALLGGAARERVRLYATCIDPGDGWGVGGAPGPYRDVTAYRTDPAALARELGRQGFAAMKGWAPDWDDPDRELALLAAAVAEDAIPVAVDLAGTVPRDRLARLLAELDALGLAWIEDPLADPDPDLLATIAAGLATPICTGESLAGVAAFDRLAAGGGVRLLHCDVGWVGGVSGALDVAGAARRHGLAMTLHDCTGPVAWSAALHVALAAREAAHVECARTYVCGPYPAMVIGLPELAGGAAVPAGPGHGCELAPAHVAASERGYSRRTRS
jgi:galactonate dehydratase